MGIHALNASFSETGVNWNNQPGHNPVAESVVQIGATGWYSWNVTGLYNSWQSSGTNYGVKLIDGNEFEGDTQRDWDTREGGSFVPYLEVTDSADSMTEVGSVLPTASNEFVVNYARGCIAFHSALAGATVNVSYWGLGSNITAELLQEEFG